MAQIQDVREGVYILTTFRPYYIINYKNNL